MRDISGALLVWAVGFMQLALLRYGRNPTLLTRAPALLVSLVVMAIGISNVFLHIPVIVPIGRSGDVIFISVGIVFAMWSSYLVLRAASRRRLALGDPR
jgi:heme A synthase